MTTTPSTPDLRPAAAQLAKLVENVSDEQLSLPTPCPGYTVAALLDHVSGLGLAFAACARKDISPELTGTPPMPSAEQLDPRWRATVPPSLNDLAEAWRDSSAWDGMTQVGGVDLPGQVAGLVAMNEIVIHGWDIARATGQPFDADEASLLACTGFLEQAPDRSSGQLFGPIVEVADGASLLQRVIGLAGRDPAWRAEQ
jgi:uncharacterized protein (TIGR03086 family)